MNLLSISFFILTALTPALGACSDAASKGLVFDKNAGIPRSITLPTGETVKYTAFERLYFVTNVEDSTYQYMNVFVPEGADETTPIFLRTYVGGYMASEASYPQAGDATGRALLEGYVVAIPGSRGRNSKVGETWTGRAPAAILDLKAAIRYLRHFDREMPGDAETIITDGTSAGGAMSALMGTTGNAKEFEPYLEAMGAAKERDDVFASVCYCPIIDLEHADMAYEWMYGNTDSRQGLPDEQKAISEELAGQFPAYLASLELRKPDGSLLTVDNYLDYIREELIRAAQKAKDAGADIPPELGFSFSGKSRGRTGEYILDLDMPTYLNYVVSTQPLKGVPAFDSKDVAGSRASGENDEFGDARGSSVNYTMYAASRTGAVIDAGLQERVYLMNPMNFIGRDGNAAYWYIRHGARDRDTAFPVPVNFATKLRNAGLDVDFLLAWNRPHSGDYALDELFEWIKSITLLRKSSKPYDKKSAALEKVDTGR
ncbi:MAG: subtype B tannase [Candidatus Cryptobacteroides sp.]